jgi:hypothetical protein
MPGRAAALALLLALTGCDKDKSGGEADSAELRTLRQQVERFEVRLGRLRAAASAGTTLPAEGCSRETLGPASLNVPLIDSQYLPGGSSGVNRKGARDPWTFLTSRRLRAIESSRSLDDLAQATDALFNIKKFESDYPVVAVLRTTKRAAPRLEGDRFVAGEFEGELTLFRWKDEKALCKTSVFAQSSQEVAGEQGSAPERAVWHDFVLAVRTQLERSAAALAPELDLDLD